MIYNINNKYYKMKVIAIGDPHFMTKNIPEIQIFIEKIIILIKKRIRFYSSN